MKKYVKTLTLDEQKIWKNYVDDLSEKNKTDLVLSKRKIPKPISVILKKDEQFSVSNQSDHDFNKSLLIDKKIYSKLRSGRLKPERILDLHGLRYDDAQKKVEKFVSRAYQDKIRLILIITGKGKKLKDNESFFSYKSGIIKHSLPRWLNSNSVNKLILNVSFAHVSHGGTGAYYVYLRRKYYKT